MGEHYAGVYRLTAGDPSAFVLMEVWSEAEGQGEVELVNTRIQAAVGVVRLKRVSLKYRSGPESTFYFSKDFMAAAILCASCILSSRLMPWRVG